MWFKNGDSVEMARKVIKENIVPCGSFSTIIIFVPKRPVSVGRQGMNSG